MLDFTLQKYKELCKCILQSTYEPITVKEYFSNQDFPGSIIILRHDVDRNPERAETMASVENDFGIKSTYYFRLEKHVFKPSIIKSIARMGHEIGYHYEVLDKAKGNMGKAYSIFKEELNLFREIVDVKTIAMHGNPLTRWINSDFWKIYSLNEFNLIAEASLSVKDKNMLYYTDTGRNWNPLKHNLKDFISINNEKISNNLQSTEDIIDLITKSKGISRLYLSVHPNRWNDEALKWFLQFMEDSLGNLIKIVISLIKGHKYHAVKAAPENAENEPDFQSSQE